MGFKGFLNTADINQIAAEVTPVGQIGDYNFEVGAMTREIAEGYEKLVRD